MKKYRSVQDVEGLQVPPTMSVVNDEIRMTYNKFWGKLPRRYLKIRVKGGQPIPLTTLREWRRRDDSVFGVWRGNKPDTAVIQISSSLTAGGRNEILNELAEIAA